MKIESLEIVDPRMKGQYQDPYLIVHVDEEVEEVGDAIYDHTKSHQFRLIPCGPFYSIEYRPDSALIHWYELDYVQSNPDKIKKPVHPQYSTDPADVGFLNKIGLIREQLFPVLVDAPDDSGQPLSMEVPRLRRLLRKHTGRTWNLIIDEEAGLRGLLKWRLESSLGLCYGGHMPNSDRCDADAARVLVVNDTHLPLCPKHVRDHEARLRAARTAPRTAPR